MQSNEQTQSKPPLRDRLIPWYFVAAFGVVFAVNIIFVYMATHTHSGLATEQAYEKGLDYNETLARAEAVNALNWHSEIEYREGKLVVQLQDDTHRGISGADVKAYFVRPAQQGFDFSMALAPTGQGRYEVEVDFPLPGQWEVKIGAVWQQHIYQATRRILVE